MASTNAQSKVVLALAGLDAAGAVALLRAHAFAAASAARLLVLWVVSPRLVFRSETLSRLRTFCARELPYPLGPGVCRVVAGDFVAEVARFAEHSDLVVLGASRWAGRAAEQLARGSQLPVLVARPARRGCVLGATNLEHARYPVLSQLATLQRRLETKAVVVHSVGHDEPEAAVKSRLERLRTAAGDRLAWADLVVTQQASPVLAILSLARQHDSDLIVVGAPRTEVRMFGRSVTEEVVARARRSVWVTPLEV